jgi:outer membrane biogenesis lipoprotein LolB
MYKKFSIVLTASLFLFACSHTPKTSVSRVSESEAKTWFAHYCSKGPRVASGDIVIRANTKEFKGQFPASTHFEANGGFVLEVTNIVGGTILRLTSDGKSMDMLVPSKPQYNRKNITHYLGLELPILSELLLGDLPCPNTWKSGGVRVDGNRMQIVTPTWNWNFEKAEVAAGSVPVHIRLEAVQKNAINQAIDLQIDDWDTAAHYAKKVEIKSAEGELKWTWRNRN